MYVDFMHFQAWMILDNKNPTSNVYMHAVTESSTKKSPNDLYTVQVVPKL